MAPQEVGLRGWNVCRAQLSAFDPAQQVKTMYRIAFSREPSAKELENNLAFLKKQGEGVSALTDLAHVTLNLNEFAYVE